MIEQPVNDKESGFSVGDNVQYIENNHFYTVEKKNTEYFLTSQDHTSGFWTDEKNLRDVEASLPRRYLGDTPARPIPSDGSDTGSALTSKHYNSKLIQPIEISQMVLTHEEFIGAMKFNIMKYTQRAGSKEGESSTKDWNKALQYKLWLEMAERGETIDPRKDVV